MMVYLHQWISLRKRKNSFNPVKNKLLPLDYGKFRGTLRSEILKTERCFCNKRQELKNATSFSFESKYFCSSRHSTFRVLKDDKRRVIKIK